MTLNEQDQPTVLPPKITIRSALLLKTTRNISRGERKVVLDIAIYLVRERYGLSCKKADSYYVVISGLAVTL